MSLVLAEEGRVLHLQMGCFSRCSTQPEFMSDKSGHSCRAIEVFRGGSLFQCFILFINSKALRRYTTFHFAEHKMSYSKNFTGGKENITVLKFFFPSISSGYTYNYFHCIFKQTPSFKRLVSILML